MRLWTIHPKYLDASGLVALWREGLLARAVLRGNTRGYRRHPQLERFLGHAYPRLAINSYLAVIKGEAASRGYTFDASKVGPVRAIDPISVNAGQLTYEWQHLLAKLSRRTPTLCEKWSCIESPDCHPLFQLRPGLVEPWERGDR